MGYDYDFGNRFLSNIYTELNIFERRFSGAILTALECFFFLLFVDSFLGGRACPLFEDGTE